MSSSRPRTLDDEISQHKKQERYFLGQVSASRNICEPMNNARQFFHDRDNHFTKKCYCSDLWWINKSIPCVDFKFNIFIVLFLPSFKENAYPFYLLWLSTVTSIDHWDVE